MLLTFAPALLTFAAQQPARPSLEIRPANVTPEFAGVYHPRFGFRESTEHRTRFGPEVVWNSPPLANYYSVPSAGQEWIDGGTLHRRHQEPREQFNSLEFTYCTSIDPPEGLASTFRFYDEHVECRGPSAWPIANCSYELVGLPGHTNPNSSLSCWLVAVDLTGLECNLGLDPVQDRMFGWSNTWKNDDTGPWLASSWAQGVDNSWVWFDRNTMSYLGCYWNGGFPVFQFDLKLWGQPPEVFAYSAQSGVGKDMTLGIEAHDTARVGGTALFTLIDLTQGISAEAPGLLFGSTAPAEFHLQSRFGLDAYLLIDDRQVQWRSFSDHGMHQSPAFPPSAQGKSVFVQGVQLANALPTRLTAHALEMIVQ